MNDFDAKFFSFSKNGCDLFLLLQRKRNRLKAVPDVTSNVQVKFVHFSQIWNVYFQLSDC